MKQKTEIEIGLNETYVYVSRREKAEAYCPHCKSLAEMSAPQAAAIMAQITEREVFWLIESDQIQFTESGRPFVCLSSLANFKRLPAAITVSSEL